MAINGKQVKNQILTDLLSWLWLGKVGRAIKVLQDVSQDQIKNTKELKALKNLWVIVRALAMESRGVLTPCQEKDIETS